MSTQLRTVLASCVIAVLLACIFTQQNQAASNVSIAKDEPFLGEVRLVAFNFTPKGWANCDGQLLKISSNTALFSLLGTTYGGDGRTTFALPDLRGRSAVHVGKGARLAEIRMGQKGGNAKVDTNAESGTTTQASLGMRYIIAISGSFPSRG